MARINGYHKIKEVNQYDFIDYTTKSKTKMIRNWADFRIVSEIKRLSKYIHFSTFARNSIFVWSVGLTYPYLKIVYGILTPRRGAKENERWLYWDTQNARSVIKNPVFLPLKEAFNRAYNDYLMFKLQGEEILWLGPKPEEFLDEDEEEIL